MKKILLILFFIANSTFAASLKDVKILRITPAKDSFELKLHASQGPKGSYFFVDITKSDAEAFSKLAFVIKKLERGNKFRLDLDIPSFSMSPSGSYYRSQSVNILGYDIKK